MLAEAPVGSALFLGVVLDFEVAVESVVEASAAAAVFCLDLVVELESV